MYSIPIFSFLCFCFIRYKQSSFSCDSHYTKKGRKTSSHNEAGRGIGRGRGRGRGEHPCYSEKFEYPVGGFPNYDKSKSVHLNHSPDLNYTDGDRSSGFHDNSSIVQSDYSISPPITVSNIHSHLGLNTDEAIKNEIEWLTYRIQNQTKKVSKSNTFLLYMITLLYHTDPISIGTKPSSLR